MGWRVQRNSPFLHRALKHWTESIRVANNEEIKTLSDIIRNVYDRVVLPPTHVLLPLAKHRLKVQRLVALTTPLYRRRQLLLQLGRWLVPPAVLHQLSVP